MVCIVGKNYFFLNITDEGIAMGINVIMTMAKFCNGVLTRVSIVFAHISQSPLPLSSIKNKYYIYPRDRCIHVAQLPIYH